MQQLLEHVRRHEVNLDGNICAVMVTTMILEVGSVSQSSDMGNNFFVLQNEIMDENIRVF